MSEQTESYRRMAVRPVPPATRFGFESLVLTEPRSLATRRGTPWAVSLVFHALLIAAIVIVPFFFDDVLPAPNGSVRTFIVTPTLVAPAPPPPPPPALAVRANAQSTVAPRAKEPAKFVAPIETPTALRPQEGISPGVGADPGEGNSLGVGGGVPGGVEGGVVGGIVGGLQPEAPPPPPATIVRVGSLNAPKLVRKVDPEYPELARAARLSALVILEVTVDARGRVRDVTVLRGQPVFDDAAVAAVRQWIYKPLLQNGVPTAFIVTVTLTFNAKAPQLRAG
jgi:periplasmic protein TonB